MGETITINPVTRIEGHAKVTVDLGADGAVVSAHLQVLELRGFEKLLEGTELFKMPQITARVCGVCPAAHLLASVRAIEGGLGIEPPRDALLLRELLYVGHLLHSHALSSFVLVGPDVLVGVDAAPADRSVFGLLRLDPELAKKALRLRSIGQRTVEAVGGRGVHPVTAVPGGISARPARDVLETIGGWGKEAAELIGPLAEALRARLEALTDMRLALPLDCSSLALSRGGTVSFLDGEPVLLGLDGARRGFATAEYDRHLAEHVLLGSYMKAVRLRGADPQRFMVGPLARINVNDAFSTPLATAELKALRVAGPLRYATDFIEARLVEMLHCAERMRELAGEVGDGPLRVAAAPREGRFIGAVEAPRGLLIHDYRVDAAGRVAEVNLIVATQNNYDAIDSAITSAARHLLPAGNDNRLLNGIEFALRCFDPCLSCATHVAGRMPLQVHVRRCGDIVRTIERRSRA